MSHPMPTVVSIHVGLPRTFGTEGAPDPLDRPWTSGIDKHATAGPVRLTRLNLEGDAQADLNHHGGPDKAVCVYPRAHYPAWRRELRALFPDLSDEMFDCGAFGENFCVDGLTEPDVCIGDVFAIGTARVQLTQPRQPCWKLARRWRLKDLAARVQHTGRTGWYFRVLEEGLVEAGQPLVLLERPHPEWTVARANTLMHHDRANRTDAAALAACPPLSQNWRRTLARRATTGENSDPRPRLIGPNDEA